MSALFRINGVSLQPLKTLEDIIFCVSFNGINQFFIVKGCKQRIEIESPVAYCKVRIKGFVVVMEMEFKNILFQLLKPLCKRDFREKVKMSRVKT